MLELKDEDKKTSLEDLLRVKRAEKPDDAFWQKFDRDLEKRIVKSVVHRESPVQSVLQWVYHHGKSITAISCVSVGAYFLFSDADVAPVKETYVADVRPAPAATEALAKVDTWSSGSAPSLKGSEQDYVIEVLSSGAGPSSGAGRSWLGNSSQEDSGSYYVADQLSSSELGWSGERLPF
ncbi:hypothetical protein [Puniceicoccus vermicola]|uniref:Uncharacterized protein n=1 Tax=Puniceicoccus vermicola TaxID=388746 RepID=A0A7X1B1Z2_9BACT|nr:hypothetical protein [Puniceicoccus vermicola]MBC2604139.1 hypothetical protein [Puniceicoccus vermicola]